MNIPALVHRLDDERKRLQAENRALRARYEEARGQAEAANRRADALRGALGAALRDCATCGGRGFAWVEPRSLHWPRQVPCPRCAGLRAVLAGGEPGGEP